MEATFRTALLWHMEHHKTTISELVAATGVSRDVINKLRTRAEATTSAENSILIAAYYGKSVNRFVSLKESSASDRMLAMMDLLTPEEQLILDAQIQGIVSRRLRG